MAEETKQSEMFELAKTVEVQTGGIQVKTMADMVMVAKMVVASGLAPDGLNDTNKVMVALATGAEMGLAPMRSLQSIYVVKGRPTLWGDAAKGLVLASPICEYVEEGVDGEGEQMEAWCKSKRKGSPNVVERRFSVQDAKTAGLWGKGGPWKTHPKRMLMYKARAFCLRDNFSDVLNGLSFAEEMDNAPEPGHTVTTPTRAERKAVESETVEPTEPTVELDVTQQLEELGQLFNDTLAVARPGCKDIAKAFRNTVAFICGGGPSLYEQPDDFTAEVIAKVKAVLLSDGIPAPVLEEIPQ